MQVCMIIHAYMSSPSNGAASPPPKKKTPAQWHVSDILNKTNTVVPIILSIVEWAKLHLYSTIIGIFVNATDSPAVLHCQQTTEGIVTNFSNNNGARGMQFVLVEGGEADKYNSLGFVQISKIFVMMTDVFLKGSTI